MYKETFVMSPPHPFSLIIWRKTGNVGMARFSTVLQEYHTRQTPASPGAISLFGISKK
jgi:hypothetical protein